MADLDECRTGPLAKCPEPNDTVGLVVITTITETVYNYKWIFKRLYVRQYHIIGSQKNLTGERLFALSQPQY